MDYLNDRSWMYRYATKVDRCQPEFSDGIVFFKEFAKQRLGVQESGQLRCPCAKCKNKNFFNCDTVMYHIAREGFVLHKMWRDQRERFDQWFEAMSQSYKWVGADGTTELSSTEAKKFLKPILQKLIRDNRCYLRRDYVEGRNPEEYATTPIPTITQDSWDLLLEYWEQEEVKEMSKKNKINRSKQNILHTLGTRSLPRYYEQQKKEQGDSFSLFHGYVGAHRKKDGMFPTDATREICEHLRAEAITRQVSESRNPEDLTSVMDHLHGGHHGGYERGFGHGYVHDRAGRVRRSASIQETALLREEVTELKYKEAATQRELAIMREQIAIFMQSHQHQTRGDHNENANPDGER